MKSEIIIDYIKELDKIYNENCSYYHKTNNTKPLDLVHMISKM